MATLGHVAVGVVAARWRASRPRARPLAVAMLGLAALRPVMEGARGRNGAVL